MADLIDAIHSIATIIGCPANADPLTDLDGLLMAVRGMAERVVGVEARIADAVAADRMAIGAYIVRNGDHPRFAQCIEHGDHIDDDDAPPLPSLRMVMLARDEAWRQVEALTTERDRRIDPVEHARATVETWIAAVRRVRAMPRQHAFNWWMVSPERAALLARVGADVLAEVER
jgi:hypothetical protein